MRVVTTGATHFVFAHRHVSRPQHARPLVFMALETCLFRICVNRQTTFAFPRHHVMAFIAGHVGHLMSATLPVQGDLFLVALLADLVFLLWRDGFKRNDGGLLFIETRCRNVSARRPVAGFAGFCKGFSQLFFEIQGVLGFGEGLYIIFVTIKAGTDGAG